MQDSSDKTQRIRGLETGKGIQHLLSEAYEVFGHPILIHDMEYKVVDYNKNIVTDDPIWNEYIATGTVGYDWLMFFKNECFLEAAANAKKITFLTSDKLKYNRIYGKLFNKNKIQVGCAIMMASSKPFEYNDPVLFEEFCDILTGELSGIKHFTDYGQAYFEKLMDDLIAGADDIALYTAHVESIYMHLKSNLYLAIADVGQSNPTYTQLVRFRDLLKKTQPEYTYAIHANYILIIIDTDAAAIYVEKDLNRLNQLFNKRGIYAGISRSFENLFELDKYYKEALGVLNNGLKAIGQNIFLYDKLNGC